MNEIPVSMPDQPIVIKTIDVDGLEREEELEDDNNRQHPHVAVDR